MANDGCRDSVLFHRTQVVSFQERLDIWLKVLAALSKRGLPVRCCPGNATVSLLIHQSQLWLPFIRRDIAAC